MNDTGDESFPREWLPEPVASPDGDDAAEWERRLQHLLSAAEPKLAELARTAGSTAPSPSPRSRTPWWAALAGRWKPALAAAAFAAAALVLGLQLGSTAGSGPAASARAFTLTAVAGGGEPAALWQGLGTRADPVLAQVVLQGGS